MKEKDLGLAYLAAIAVEVIYGFSYYFTKQAMGQASAQALLGWRSLFAWLTLTLLIRLDFFKFELKGRPWLPLIKVAIFFPVLYLLAETLGIHYTSSSESGVFLASIPVVSLILSKIMLNEKTHSLQLIGILMTVIGVVVTVLAVGLESSFSIMGYAFLLVAVLSYALYTVYVYRAGSYSSLEITYVMQALGALFFVPLALAESLIQGKLIELVLLPFHQPVFLMAILYQSLACSVLVAFLSIYAISKIGVNRTVSFIGISTVVSIAAGAFLLQEEFTLWQMVGTLIIIMGVYTANARDILSRKSESGLENQ